MPRKDNSKESHYINEILTWGDSYSIPLNIEHSWEVLEAGEVIDVFTPLRQDYL
jgi:quercetin dioxygenase-like cupin family protein